MIKLLRNLKTNKSGASAAEYALLIALVGGGIIVAAGTLGSNISTVFTKTGSAITAAAPQ